jgi:putative transcriptional regulator
MSSRIAIVPEQPANPQPRLARGKFLVANKSLQDPTFVETVVLLVDYDDNGALGVVVNRPTDVPLTAALPEVDELRKRKDLIFLGGPVARDRMVLLLRAAAAPPQSVQVFDQVYATGSLSALRSSIGHGESVRAYAGYAGWGPGQLDAEVARGDWLIGPADSKAIFDDPPKGIWPRFVERFSGDWATLAPLHTARAFGAPR